MTARANAKDDRWSVRLYRQRGGGWSACERELARAGLELPVSHRAAWARATGEDRWLLGAYDPAGRCRAALGVSVTATRALPGYRVLRADKVGLVAKEGGEPLRALLRGLRRLAVEEPRVLRVEVALFSADPARRALLREELALCAFAPAPVAIGYLQTPIVDLGGSEEELLAGFHATARRHIRAATRHPVKLGLLRDPARAADMARLIEETRRRTGGPVPKRPLAAMISLADRHPDLLRIVGLVAKEDDALLAFACGHREGDLVRYADAGSTRRTSLKLPLGYAPLWDLMRWARRTGARRFDLGGITEGTSGDADPVGGISDFKRYFRGTVTDVGDEWTFEPRPALARWSRQIRHAAESARASVRAVSAEGRRVARPVAGWAASLAGSWL